MQLEQILHPHRKALVLAAESAVRDCRDKLPDRSQFNRLISICGDASCVEEIGNYLRYQASRQGTLWRPEFAKLVIDKIQAPLEDLDQTMREHTDAQRDLARIGAWRLYAVFLSRAAVFAIEQQKPKRGNHDRARR